MLLYFLINPTHCSLGSWSGPMTHRLCEQVLMILQWLKLIWVNLNFLTAFTVFFICLSRISFPSHNIHYGSLLHSRAIWPVSLHHLHRSDRSIVLVHFLVKCPYKKDLKLLFKEICFLKPAGRVCICSRPYCGWDAFLSVLTIQPTGDRMKNVLPNDQACLFRMWTRISYSTECDFW